MLRHTLGGANCAATYFGWCELCCDVLWVVRIVLRRTLGGANYVAMYFGWCE